MEGLRWVGWGWRDVAGLRPTVARRGGVAELQHVRAEVDLAIGAAAEVGRVAP